MKCLACGNLNRGVASFCARCGTSIKDTGIASSVDQDAKIDDLPVEKLPNPIWLWLSALLTIAVDAAIFLPAFEGQQLPKRILPSSLWIHGLFFYFFWGTIGKRGWQGALVGVGVGVAVIAVAGFVSGFVSRSYAG